MIQDTVEREIESVHGTVEIEGFECYHCGEFTSTERVLGIGLGESGTEYECVGDEWWKIEVGYKHSLYVCEYCAESLYDVENVRSGKTLGTYPTPEKGVGLLTDNYWTVALMLVAVTFFAQGFAPQWTIYILLAGLAVWLHIGWHFGET